MYNKIIIIIQLYIFLTLMNKIYYYVILFLLLWVISLAILTKPKEKNMIGNTATTETILSTGGTLIPTGNTTTITGDIQTGQDSSLTYTNTEYGFQLTLPKDWEGYKVFIYTGSTIDSKISISFTLPTTDKTRYGVINPNDKNQFISWYTGQYQYIKWYADMFMLNIWTYKWYQKTINTEDAIWTKDAREGATRGKSEKYFYTMNSWPQDLPVDISKKIKFGSYYGDIKNSFKIL